MKNIICISICLIMAMSTRLMAADQGRGIGGVGMCNYYACGTCGDGTVMLCATGELDGCIDSICSDVVSPAGSIGNSDVFDVFVNDNKVKVFFKNKFLQANDMLNPGSKNGLFISNPNLADEAKTYN